MILAPNIECIKYAEEHPDFTFNLDSFDGLNVFPLVTFVHFDNPAFRDVYRKILMDALENEVPFITLRDNQFIYVDGETWRVVDSERSPGAGPGLLDISARWNRRSQFGYLAGNYLSFAPLLNLPS